VSLLLCDIDHFKRINDTHGHLVGDEVLQVVSDRLLDAVRMYDAVGRYGGEEFLIVLTGCVDDDLRNRAEQVRKAISSFPIPTTSGPIFASMSVGAITIENWETALPIELFLKQADNALYQAKAAGRDKVVYANSRLTV
jgi:diguanylate cyclase (GGDEF)-like protein